MTRYHSKHWRRLSLFLVVALVVGMFSASALGDEHEEPEVTLNVGSTEYTVNGEEKEMDVAPFIQEGRTLVPVRFVAEELGLEASSGPDEGPTEWVHLEKEGLKIEITIGDPEILVIENGDERTETSDVPAQIQDGRTFLPLRTLGQVLGAHFDWGPKDAPTEWVTFTMRDVPVEEYEVGFLVWDEEEAPLEGAVIEMNDEVEITDEDGLAVFEEVAPGNYDFELTLLGYRTEVGGITVVDEDLLVEVTLEEADMYAVDFLVLDSETEEPLEGAIVQIGETMEETDEEGRAFFPEVFEGDQLFMVELYGYQTESDIIVVEEDMEEILVLLEPAEIFEVSFLVVDADTEEPLEGAEVEIADMVELTDEEGRAFFPEVVEDEYQFTVTLEGYEILSDIIIVEEDMEDVIVYLELEIEE